MKLFFAHYAECLFSEKRFRPLFANRNYWNAALLVICVALFFVTLFFIQKPDSAIQNALTSLATAIPLIFTGMAIPFEPKGLRSAAGWIALAVNFVGIVILEKGISSLIDHFDASYHIAFENAIYIALGIYAVSCLFDAWSLTLHDPQRKGAIQSEAS